MLYSGDSMSLKLFLAVIPVIIILIVVYNKDRSKEPLTLLLGLFMAGIGSCFLVLFISEILGNFLPFMNISIENQSFTQTLLYAFIGVALVEEFCKWFMIFVIGYNNKEFDEIYDIIVYSIFVSLGFAFFENIVYVLQSEHIITAIVRAVSAVPSHACDAVFMGYYLSVAKQCSYKGMKNLESKNIVLSILIPTLLHGIYDFCLMSGIPILVFVFIAFVVALYVISIKRLKTIADSNRKIKYKNRFCGMCGSRVEGEFCGHCGRRQE